MDRPELTPEEIQSLDLSPELRDRGIAQTQRQKIYKWGNEPCPHDNRITKDINDIKKKFECPTCRRELNK
jgi:hypothetical protein